MQTFALRSLRAFEWKPGFALHPDELAAVGPRLLIRQAEARLSCS